MCVHPVAVVIMHVQKYEINKYLLIYIYIYVCVCVCVCDCV